MKKHVLHIRFAPRFAAVLGACALAAGCGSLLPEGAPPARRYALADAPLPKPASEDAGAGETWVVGRVRAARGADGRALRVVDETTGRSAFYGGGELADTPEALVASRLRRAIAAARPKAVVADASLAPTGAERTLVECWIEEFRLVRRADGLVFRFAATLYTTPPGGAAASRRVEAEVAVPAGEPAAVFRAVAEATALNPTAADESAASAYGNAGRNGK